MELDNLGNENTLENLSFDKFKETVLNDYKIVCISRDTSLLGRKEVLTGKAKFGIFGDGKEVPQVAMAKFFKPGDFRSGYYRDQTFQFATGLHSVEQFFSQLYADPDPDHEPSSAGRQMDAHFATANVDKDGNWLHLSELKNVASDISPVSGQMPRALGLAYASKLFRENPELSQFDHLSHNGDEVCFCTIGDSGTSEGSFWEIANAAAVLQVPLAIFVWDDGYGISVPKKYQTVKSSISEAMSGFQKTDLTNGLNIYKLKAWDYAGLCETLESAIEHIRKTHTPALFHIEEVTQPQGHSTSGSHERYKTPERLQWEREWDCKKQMREWIIANALATEEELEDIETDSKRFVKESRDNAWEKFMAPITAQVEKTVQLIKEAATKTNSHTANRLIQELTSHREPVRKNIMKTLFTFIEHPDTDKQYIGDIQTYFRSLTKENKQIYNSHLYNEGPKSALKVTPVPAAIDKDAPLVNGYEIINQYFDQLFARNKKVVAFGEDVGQIGDVNQGFSGLQRKYGVKRIFDTGIRENAVVGEATGMALRGLRPIAEIQYLDYIYYAMPTLTDDIATTHYRTAGIQSVPVIIRTRGHRLEGIWHSGSPMGMLVNSLRGMYICVPRNLTQAAGMYNTLLESNDPGLVIESLNGYRLKEPMVSNLSEFKVPLGVPEILREGTDITIVSYGSVLRKITKAADFLETLDINCEIIDVQTLLPFDINSVILESLKKTSRILFVDEDVPGGAAAYMFNMVMEKQGGYRWLDASPRTLTGKDHRPAYGTDGDFYSKPSTESIIDICIDIMAE